RLNRQDAVIARQRQPAPPQLVFDRLWMFVEAVDPATTGDDAVMPETVASIDLPQHRAGCAVHADQRHTAGAVERFGAKAGLVAVQLAVLFVKRKLKPFAVFGKSNAADQHIAIDT